MISNPVKISKILEAQKANSRPLSEMAGMGEQTLSSSKK